MACVVLVTGRRAPAARHMANQIAPDLPMVSNNGGLLIEAGAFIRRRPLSRDLAREAIGVGKACAADPAVHSGPNGEGRLLVESDALGHTLRAYYIDSANPAVVQVEGLEAVVVEDVVQVMFGGELAAMEALLPRLQVSLGSAVNIERTSDPALGMGLIDVLAAGVTKGEAVSFFETRWGLEASRSLAIGDNWNDGGMLEQAGLGFVMGNADPAMHRLGLPVLPLNEDRGTRSQVRNVDGRRSRGREVQAREARRAEVRNAVGAPAGSAFLAAQARFSRALGGTSTDGAPEDAKFRRAKRAALK